MLRVTFTNDEERVVRLALEEFIARERRYTSNNPVDQQHIVNRNTAREALFTMRSSVPEPERYA